MRSEASIRESIQANRSLLRAGLGAPHAVKALRILEARLEKAGLPAEMYHVGGTCKHVWWTQDEPMGAAYCYACGEPDMVGLAEATMDRCCDSSLKPSGASGR